MRRALAAGLLMAAAVPAGLVAGCGDGGDTDASSGVRVELTATGCTPERIGVPAGPVTITVTNRGAAAGAEFEVIDGDRVLGEAENIPEGGSRSFSLTLAPGDYATACPGADAGRGVLVATASGATTAAADPAAVRAATAYRGYARRQADLLVRRTDAFTGAVLRGDAATARRLYATAREPFERIEPIAESFGDLDPAIDAREGDVPRARWTGFHRLERALWQERDLAGTAPVARRLRADVRRLRDRVAGVELQAAQIANGASGLLDEVAASKITGEEDRYSHTDLWDFAANLDGAREAYRVLRPLVAGRDPALATLLDRRFAEVAAALDAHRSGDGYVLFTELTPAQTRSLATRVDALAEPLSTVAALVNR